MTRSEMMELAAKAQLASVINGKLDAFYVPPDSIEAFGHAMIEHCAVRVEQLGSQGFGALAIAALLRKEVGDKQ